MALDPYLRTVLNKVPILKVFAHRIRTGELAYISNSIRARSAEDYLGIVCIDVPWYGGRRSQVKNSRRHRIQSETYDCRMEKERSTNELRKTCPYSSSSKNYSSSPSFDLQHHYRRVRLDHPRLLLSSTPRRIHRQSFRYNSLPSPRFQLFVGDCCLDLNTASDAQILSTCFGALTFTDQKNGVHGDVIGLVCSGHPYVCPVRVISS